MKHILVVAFLILNLIGYSQAKLSMSKVFSITPTSAGTSSVGVNFGDTVTLLVSVKNTGNQPFSGNIVVDAKRDTVAGVSCGSNTLSVTSLFPGDSIPGVITFTPTSGINAFKVGGNGNTIVVWPFAISALPGDSVRPVVWISPLLGINEFGNSDFKLFPNPANNTISIIPSQKEVYQTIMVYDILARKCKEISFQENINISDLDPGCYWLFITSDKKTYKLKFIKQ